MSIYDTQQQQVAVMRDIMEKGKFVIENPTSPFVLQTESMISTIGDAMQEMLANDNRIYPALATSKDDLYHHMTTMDEDVDAFATPTKGTLRVFLSYEDIISNGVKTDNGGSTITIPKDTVLLIDSVEFRLMFDIDVSVVDNKTYVYQNSSDNILYNTKDTILKSAIVEGNPNDETIAKWVVFDVETLQVSKTTTEGSIIRTVPFKLTVPLNGKKYYRSVARFKSGDGYVDMQVSHTDRVVDIKRPTVTVKVYDDRVEYSIPYAYIINNMVTTKVVVDTYTTEGNITINVGEVNDKSLHIKKTGNSDTIKKAAFNVVSCFFTQENIITGGINSRTTKTIRTRVIKNTLGDNNLPISEHSLFELGKKYGVRLHKALDTITKRIYYANKVDNYTTDNGIHLDILSNTVSLSSLDIEDTPIYENSTHMVIPSHTMFAVKDNHKPLKNSEVTYINSLPRSERIKYLNANRIHFSFFTYVISKDDAKTTVVVYDTDNPKIDTVSVAEVNDSTYLRVSVDSLELKKDSSYKLTGILTAKDTHAGSGVNIFENVSCVLKIPIYNSSRFVYVRGEVDSVGRVELNIKQGKYPIGSKITIDGKDENGVNITPYIDISSDAEFFILNSTGTSVNDTFSLRYSDVRELTERVIVVHKLKMDIISKLDYLDTNSSIGYTDRKYLRAETDIYKRHKHDIYRIIDGSEVILIRDNDGNVIDTQIEVTEKAGDQVYEYALDTDGSILLQDGYRVFKQATDENGTPLYDDITNPDGSVTSVPRKIPVYEYKKGDVILDNGKPVINKLGGIVYRLNILMFDFRFKMFNEMRYTTNVQNKILAIKKWLLHDLRDLNSVVLENTVILLKTVKGSTRVKTTDDKVYDVYVQPNVVLHLPSYASRVELTGKELNILVGGIISKNISRSKFSLSDIRDEIIRMLPFKVVAVTLNLHDDHKELYSLKEDSNRFTIDLDYDENHGLLYNMDLKTSIV